MSSCELCGSKGFLIDKEKKEVLLCSCTLKKCRCGGSPPYLYEEEGKILPCPCKEAREKKDLLLTRIEEASLPPRYLFKRWEDFHTDIAKDPEERSQLLIAKDSAQIFFRKFLEEKPLLGLYIYGPPGVGKTLLGCILLNEILIENPQKRVLFVKAREVPSLENFLGNKKDLVFIDDLEKMDPFLFSFIDFLYEREIPLIVSSTYPIDSWEEKISSRFQEILEGVKLDKVKDYRRRLNL